MSDPRRDIEEMELFIEGWCHRGSGHLDSPQCDDYGACGTKWSKARIVTEWREYKPFSEEWGDVVESPLDDDWMKRDGARRMWLCEGDPHIPRIVKTTTGDWIKNCIPHMDWPRHAYGQQDMYEDLHKGCGFVLVLRGESEE